MELNFIIVYIISTFECFKKMYNIISKCLFKKIWEHQHKTQNSIQYNFIYTCS